MDAKPVTFSTSFAVLQTSCHLTDSLHPLATQTSSVISGTSGTILFNCELDEAAFFVVNTGLATPVFTLPLGYTELTIVQHVPQATKCSVGSQLTSNQPFNFAQRGSFDYCAVYANPPLSGLASFDLVWSSATNGQ